jgi:hypothetical protein
MLHKLAKKPNLSDLDRRAIIHSLGVAAVARNLRVKPNVEHMAARLTIAQCWTALDMHEQEKRVFQAALTTRDEELKTVFQTSPQR